MTGHSEERMGKDSKSRFKGDRVQGEVYYYFDFPYILVSIEMIISTMWMYGHCVLEVLFYDC